MKKLAPTDAVALAAWHQIAEIAQKHALLVQAYGGIMVLMDPDEQRKRDVRELVLQSEQMYEERSEKQPELFH